MNSVVVVEEVESVCAVISSISGSLTQLEKEQIVAAAQALEVLQAIHVSVTLADGNTVLFEARSADTVAVLKSMLARKQGAPTIWQKMFKLDSEEPLQDMDSMKSLLGEKNETDVLELLMVLLIEATWDVQHCHNIEKTSFSEEDTVVSVTNLRKDDFQSVVSSDKYCLPSQHNDGVTTEPEWRIRIDAYSATGLCFGVLDSASKDEGNAVWLADHPSNSTSQGFRRAGVYFWESYNRWLWYSGGGGHEGDDCRRCSGVQASTKPKPGDLVQVMVKKDHLIVLLNGQEIITEIESVSMGGFASPSDGLRAVNEVCLQVSLSGHDTRLALVES
jgi:hypothetical protein